MKYKSVQCGQMKMPEDSAMATHGETITALDKDNCFN
jgi:hypothetical protein